MSQGQDPADVHPVYLEAFNAGDIDATVACYESQACFISKSGRAAHGTFELRKLYRAMFSYKLHLKKLEVRKIIQAGDDLGRGA
jgi:ketosteroid isomerase-like protein